LTRLADTKLHPRIVSGGGYRRLLGSISEFALPTMAARTNKRGENTATCAYPSEKHLRGRSLPEGVALMKMFRWLWFSLAAFLVLDVPFAIVGAVPDLKANLSHFLPFALSFMVRVSLVWLFLHLWWLLRPDTKIRLEAAEEEE
jgi:hypothetical protein